jgi:hypothetical protein
MSRANLLRENCKNSAWRKSDILKDCTCRTFAARDLVISLRDLLKYDGGLKKEGVQ